MLKADGRQSFPSSRSLREDLLELRLLEPELRLDDRDPLLRTVLLLDDRELRDRTVLRLERSDDRLFTLLPLDERDLLLLRTVPRLDELEPRLLLTRELLLSDREDRLRTPLDELRLSRLLLRTDRPLSLDRLRDDRPTAERRERSEDRLRTVLRLDESESLRDRTVPRLDDPEPRLDEPELRERTREDDDRTFPRSRSVRDLLRTLRERVSESRPLLERTERPASPERPFVPE